MGRTDSPAGEYSLARHTEDLSQLVRHLGLTQFVRGGVSIGGMITVHCALKHQEYRDRMARNNVMGYCSGMRARSRMRDRTGELAQRTVPTLSMLGDLARPFIAPSKLMHSRIAGSKLGTIPGAGHLANLERPKAFNEAVLACLETFPSSDAMPLSAPKQSKRRHNGQAQCIL